MGSPALWEVVEPLADETQLEEVKLGVDKIEVLKVKSPTQLPIPLLNYPNVSKQPLMTADIAVSYSGVQAFSLNSEPKSTLLP